MLMTSLKTNQQYYATFWRPTLPLHLENYIAAWQQIRPYFVTSLIVAKASPIWRAIQSRSRAACAVPVTMRNSSGPSHSTLPAGPMTLRPASGKATTSASSAASRAPLSR